jgi:hypothetical protein
VELDEAVNWADETSVQVVSAEEEDVCMDGTPWPKTEEEIQDWWQWFDSLDPMLTDEEYARFEANRLEEKEMQKTLAEEEADKLARHFR